MRAPSSAVQFISAIVALTLFVGLASVSRGQSQEPKPPLPATPIAGTDLTEGELPLTGVVDSTWQGTELWRFHQLGCRGLGGRGRKQRAWLRRAQMGTPLSTVFIEVYEGFNGDAAACLADAEREISERPGLSEVAPLEGRPAPVSEDVRGAARLFGLTATLEDGSPFRGVEYVECRTAIPGVSVVEITWQTAASSFNEDFPRVESLLGTLSVPSVPTPAGTPVGPAATPTVPLATPVA